MISTQPDKKKFPPPPNDSLKANAPVDIEQVAAGIARAEALQKFKNPEPSLKQKTFPELVKELQAVALLK